MLECIDCSGDSAAAFVAQDDYGEGAQPLDCKLDGPEGRRVDDVSCDADHEQVTEPAVKDDLRAKSREEQRVVARRSSGNATR